MSQLSFEGMGLDDLVPLSLELLRAHEPPEGYYGCFSGGKDSIVIKALARMAGVKIQFHYNNTTIDPPELIYYMREHHQDVIWHRPPHGNFFRRMEKTKGFPTRRNRWCCEEYKHSCNPDDVTLLMGIRAEESANRRKRWSAVQRHWCSDSIVVQPILSWPSEELWEFIHGEGLPYCELYDEGFHRLGCVGCPQARAERLPQFARWPRFEKRWRLSFRRIWEKRSGHLDRQGNVWFGDRHFSGPEEMFEWWLHDKPTPKVKP